MRPAAVLVTGGAGFIGSNLVRWILEHDPEVKVVNLDLLTYAGNRASLADVESRFGHAGDGRYYFAHGDVRDGALVSTLLAGGATDSLDGRNIPPVDAVLHLAAESHVDRSIVTPEAFVSTNVLGTTTLLEATRADLDARPREFRFVNVSTDEVYGSLEAEEPAFTEHHPLRPNSPYSASKAGADCLVRAYAVTYGLPCITTRCSNNYGPYQYPEKLIPFMLVRALRDEALPVYGDGANVRDWLHVLDHASALWRVCTEGYVEDGVYNIGGNAERRNIDLVRDLLAILGKPDSLITFVADRPGHDRRYAIDATRIRHRLGWTPAHDLHSGLEETVRWYLDNAQWLADVQARCATLIHS